MNIAEANAVNELLDWMLSMNRLSLAGPLDPLDPQGAAATLARGAYKRLSAGIDGPDVARHWPTLFDETDDFNQVLKKVRRRAR